MTVDEILLDALAESGSSDPDKTLSRIWIFRNYLLEINRKINLVSRQNSGSVVDSLIYDSIKLATLTIYWPPQRVLDFGSGAGFPGIIHKIMFPELELISVDANQRKIEFQRSASKLLDLRDCSFVAERIEDLLPQDAAVFVAKAVTDTTSICKLAGPHLKANGKLVLPRSTNEQFAKDQLKDLGFGLFHESTYTSAINGRETRLIIFLKEPS